MPFQAAVATQRSFRSSEPSEFDVKSKYCLDFPYVFYPAQFWAHKNHVYLLEGLKLLEEKHGILVGAIFAGGDSGNLSYVQEYAARLGLSGRVRFAGFVSNSEIPSLYQQSIALVMPTYFGPTNLPPLEAFELDVPVLYSNQPGLSDQVGDAALLMDLNNPDSMANHIKALIEDEGIRETLKKSVREWQARSSVLDRSLVLRRVIEDFRWRRICCW